jgi:hypothetical protein
MVSDDEAFYRAYPTRWPVRGGRVLLETRLLRFDTRVELRRAGGAQGREPLLGCASSPAAQRETTRPCSLALSAAPYPLPLAVNGILYVCFL